MVGWPTVAAGNATSVVTKPPLSPVYAGRPAIGLLKLLEMVPL